MIPKSLCLLGKTWSITRKSTPGKYGECQHGKLVINVSPASADDQQRDTLLHEVIHALEVEGQLKMTERQVTGLATLLLSSLRHNPKLAQFLLD
jgi:hypothetical protein